jgi:beta-1,4-mannosyltransferase
MTANSRSITIMGKPAFIVRGGNSSTSSCVCFYSHLQQLGATVLEWTPMGMFLQRYDILHLHWPDNVLSSPRRWQAIVKVRSLCAALALVRLQGKKVVWTAHNLESHEQKYPDLEKIFWTRFARNLDGIIAPMHFILDDIAMRAEFSHVPHRLTLPFGDWGGYYEAGRSREEMCDALELDPKKPVLLWFGIIRKYKGVERLLDVFGDRRLAGLQLVIAGKCTDSPLRSRLETWAAELPNVRLLARFIPDVNVQELFEMATCCVFPFRAVTNSGSVRLALTFSRHCLVPRLPFATELSGVVGAQWFTIYDARELGVDDIFSAIRNAERVAGKKVDWRDYNWESTAKKGVHFFKEVAAGGQKPG